MCLKIYSAEPMNDTCLVGAISGYRQLVSIHWCSAIKEVARIYKC